MTTGMLRRCYIVSALKRKNKGSVERQAGTSFRWLGENSSDIKKKKKGLGSSLLSIHKVEGKELGTEFPINANLDVRHTPFFQN